MQIPIPTETNTNHPKGNPNPNGEPRINVLNSGADHEVLNPQMEQSDLDNVLGNLDQQLIGDEDADADKLAMGLFGTTAESSVQLPSKVEGTHKDSNRPFWAEGLDLDETVDPSSVDVSSSDSPRPGLSTPPVRSDELDDLSWLDDLLDDHGVNDDLDRASSSSKTRSSYFGAAPFDRFEDETFDGSEEARSLRLSIGRAARAGEHSKVIQLSRKWEQKGFGPEESVSFATLKACSASGAWEVASAVIDELEAADMEEAKSLLANHPHLKWVDGCAIEVHEAIKMM